MEYFRCRIRRTKASTAILHYLHATGEVAFDHYHVAEDHFVAEFSEAEIKVLEAHGLEVQRGEELSRLAKERLKERAPPKKVAKDDDAPYQTGFVDQYLDAAQVATRMQALAAEFPALCHLSNLPHATHGYDGSEASLAGPANVQLIRITNAPALRSRPGLLLVCGTHAREWINPLIAIEFAEQILRNYDPGSPDPLVQRVNRIVEEGDTLIVPVMNPDGLNFSIHDDSGWRKNRRPPFNTACFGVDNNRNFEIFFGEGGSSPSECSDGFHGPSAFSEPENQNIRHILEEFPNVLIGVDSHSQGEDIFRPTATGGTFSNSLPVFPDDETIYQNLEAAAVAAIQAFNGKTYSTGTTSNHAGTSDEYMFFAHRVFAFDFECALSFQPPIVSALVSVQEVVAALFALAVKGLDLDLETPAPVRIVQCIDRTGSMVSFGYETPARANAKRFVDLMSLQDSVAIVSFADPSPDPDATPLADRAAVELPITLINDPGDYATARAAIDGISFGGWTSLGAGLSASATQLAAAGAPRAVVLLSDGFENRDPLVSTVLPAFPANIRVYPVALGGLADIPLLQNIATQTGGQFYLSPTSLELHEIYNQIRADASSDDTVLNELITDTADDHDHTAQVEVGVHRLAFSLSWEVPDKAQGLCVWDPSGRLVDARHWGVDETHGDGYVLVKILRPRPGTWRVCARGASGSFVLAAFVKSPLRIESAVLPPQGKRLPSEIHLRAKAPRQWIPTLTGSATFDLLPMTATRERQLILKRDRQWLDAIPFQFPLAAGPRISQRRDCGQIRLERLPEALRGKEQQPPTYRLPLPTSLNRGIYKVKTRVQGSAPRIGTFERVVLKTVVVG
ncbi:MAG TPA: M14 family zinc carboxypeptidase [Chthoniobacterales bacterium]|nr:M14 family zinc carboxypeptidase [Chthoniobacterales bacterium]